MKTDLFNLTRFFLLDKEFIGTPVTEFPGHYDNESDPLIDDLIIRLIKPIFKNALEYLEPLLDEMYITDIQVAMENGGYFDFYASYWNDKSDHEKGEYVIVIGIRMILDMLYAHWNRTEPWPEIFEDVCIHELIHLIDHDNADDGVFISRKPAIQHQQHLEQYRTEGIANFVSFLKGKKRSGVFTMDLAREFFIKEQEDFQKKQKEIGRKKKDISLLLENNGYYIVGPWMVLHALSVLYKEEEIVKTALTNIISGNKITDDTIKQTLAFALKINNQQFIDSLSLPGFDGEIFAEI